MPIIYYKCAKCKITRDSYEEAERCEKSHLSVSAVKELEYTVSPYPSRVVLVFPDGKEHVYVIDR